MNSLHTHNALANQKNSAAYFKDVKTEEAKEKMKTTFQNNHKTNNNYSINDNNYSNDDNNSSNNIQNKDHPSGDTPNGIHQLYYEILMKTYVEFLKKPDP